MRILSKEKDINTFDKKLENDSAVSRKPRVAARNADIIRRIMGN